MAKQSSGGSRSLGFVLSKIKPEKAGLATLSRCRAQLAAPDFEPFVRYVMARPMLRSRLFPVDRARTLTDTSRRLTLSPISPRRELAWARAYLQAHANDLAAFVSEAGAFHDAFLAGDR